MSNSYLIKMHIICVEFTKMNITYLQKIIYYHTYIYNDIKYLIIIYQIVGLFGH